MEYFPSVWFAFSAIVGIVVWLVLLWLAWVLVSSIRGVHTELRKIRQLLADSRLGQGPGSP